MSKINLEGQIRLFREVNWNKTQIIDKEKACFRPGSNRGPFAC